MADALNELKLDCEEVKKLQSVATRQKIKDLLIIEQRRLETEIGKRTELAQKQAENTNGDAVTESEGAVGGQPASPVTKTETKPQVYTVKITNYGWDQSDKFVKFYITLNGIQQLPKENCVIKFGEKSLHVLVNNLQGKNHELIINNLLKPIIVEDSHFKVKTDMLVVLLKKKDKETWAYVTQKEMKAKEAKKPNLDKNKDPSAGIMDLMKNMYEEGDDEMKRTIAKAWTESRNKNMGDMGM
ncbi:calcyclin-binding protein-like [Ptychodera flava]|uniref:calcyclin-binding protein-like n=1 Tax=Ptychodera flava TaxID=63121 RepID=UPI00396AA2B5